MKLAGAVILYNPSFEIFENIDSYLEDLDVLYCVDNSSQENLSLVSKLKTNKKIVYHSMNGNVGLARALSYASEKAITEGYKFLLLMDQDTEFQKDSLSQMIQVISKDEKKYSIISPNIKLFFRDENERIKSEDSLYPLLDEEPFWTITSGSIINLLDYKAFGGFDKKLFIGQIDQDYCCNMIVNRKKILRLGNAFIYQEPGNTEFRRMLWKNVKVPNYDPVRYYYIFRNEIYLRKKWKKDYKNFKAPLIKYLILILAFEKKKGKKLNTVLKGFLNGINYQKKTSHTEKVI